MTTISVVIPTIGRPTLQRAIDSCAGADEILVLENQDGDNGYRARNTLMAQATGDVLAFCDDDDVFVPDAIDLIRARAAEHPGRPLLFQMRLNGGQVIWSQPRLGYGNIGTPCIVVPNQPDKLGTWAGWQGSGSGGDCHFIHECVKRMGDPVWVERIVAHIRPD